MSFLKKLFGLNDPTEEKEPYVYKDILHLWEDDYLMIEILPKENIDFIEKETKRINEHAQKHFDGYGFTSITSIGEKPTKTIDKLIDISSVFEIMKENGLDKIEQFVDQDGTLLENATAPLGFGTNRFAIMCEAHHGLLQNIYIVGRSQTEEEKQKLSSALFAFGQLFNFIIVNWFNSTYTDLSDKESVEDFVKNHC